MFCNKCVENLIPSNGSSFKCPICREQCDAKDVIRVKFIDRQINNLTARCPNYEITSETAECFEKNQRPGVGKENLETNNSPPLKHKTDQNTKQKRLCQWIGTYGNLQKHLQICPLSLIICRFCEHTLLRRDEEKHFAVCTLYQSPCPQCDAQIERSAMKWHINSECPMTKIECQQCCGKLVHRKHTDEHIQQDCPETLVVCAYSQYGCNVKCKRKERDAHNRENVSFHLEKVKQYADLQTLLTNKYKSQVLSLRRRIDDQQAQIYDLDLERQRLIDRLGYQNKLKLFGKKEFAK